jgi:hypothetical protein
MIGGAVSRRHVATGTACGVMCPSKNGWRMDANDQRRVAELDYSPAPPVLRRRSFYKLLWFIGALGLGAVALALAPVAYQRIELLKFQRECLQHENVNRQPLDDPSVPIPAPWRSLYFNCAGSNLNSVGTVFLHERRTPAGKRRLVAVDGSPAFGPADVLYPRVIEPGSLMRSPREVGTQSVTNLAWVGKLDFRWEGSSPDPDDPSHFEIRYSVNGLMRRIDGWLRDDDSVLLEDRRREEPEATPAPPPSAGRSR